MKPCFPLPAQSLLFFVAALGALTAGCSTTNYLSEYSFVNRTAHFRSVADEDAVSASVWIDDPLPGEPNYVTPVVSILGSIFGTVAADNKFCNAIRGPGVAEAVNEQFQMTVANELGLTPVDREGDAAYYFVTRLKSISLEADGGGVFLELRASLRVFQGNDKEEIYNINFAHTLPMRERYDAPIDAIDYTASGVVHTADLLSMSDAEIWDAVAWSSAEMGRLLAGRFLRDERYSKRRRITHALPKE